MDEFLTEDDLFGTDTYIDEWDSADTETDTSGWDWETIGDAADSFFPYFTGIAQWINGDPVTGPQSTAPGAAPVIAEDSNDTLIVVIVIVVIAAVIGGIYFFTKKRSK